MTVMIEASNKWRTRPVYTISQAAKLAGTHYINVRRWLYGINNESTKMRPVFGKRDKSQEKIAEVSFLDLAEIVVW